MDHETKARTKTDRNIRHAFLSRTALSKQKKEKKEKEKTKGTCSPAEWGYVLRESVTAIMKQADRCHTSWQHTWQEHINKARCAVRTACGIIAGCVTRFVPGNYAQGSEGAMIAIFYPQSS